MNNLLAINSCNQFSVGSLNYVEPLNYVVVLLMHTQNRT